MPHFDSKTEQLLADALADVATPDQLAALNAALATDDALLDEYLRLVRTDAALHFQHGHVTTPDFTAKAGGPSGTPGTPHNPPLSAAGVPMYRKGYEPQPFKLRAHHVALIAATLLAACGLAAYLLTASVDPKPDPVDPNQPPAPVATLIQNTGDLRTPHGYPAEGDDYGRGEYTLSTGTAEFMLTNAVNVKLRGETRMIMRNDMHVSLTRGSARFVCPTGAAGFTVNLPDGLKVVDLGTAFETTIDAGGRSTVRVTDGLVEVHHGDRVETVKAGHITQLIRGRLVTTQSAFYVAYNDFGGGLSGGNVTNISGLGNNRPAGSDSPSGTLVQFSDGFSTGVTLTISGSSGNWNYKPLEGAPMSGDAASLFNGFVNANGMTDFEGVVTLEFSGMDPNRDYDVALYASRGDYDLQTTRQHSFTISGVDAFANVSSDGATIATSETENDTASYDVTRNSNAATGYVARFTAVRPGANGEFQIVITSENFIEINAMRFEMLTRPKDAAKNSPTSETDKDTPDDVSDTHTSPPSE